MISGHPFDGSQPYSTPGIKTPLMFEYQENIGTASSDGPPELFKGKNQIHFFENRAWGSTGPAAKILVIDDDPFNVKVLEGLSETLSFDILKAYDGPSALSIMNRLDVDLVLLDIDRPGIDGFEICRRLKAQGETKTIPIVFLSSNLDQEKKLKGFKAGGDDFISKPFHPEELLAKVRTHLELSRFRGRLEAQVEKRTAQLNRFTEEAGQRSEKFQKSMNGIIQALALTVETRDPYTNGHQRRVAELSRAIAQEMGRPAEMIIGLHTAAWIHDLGKIMVPVEILTKSAKLSETEFGLIKLHAEVGYSILEDIDFPWPVARMVLEHHERINGSGYPNRLTGEKLLIESRILAVADVVEAITSYRPYRLSFGIEMALDEIEKAKAILYEAEVVEACLRLFREKRFSLE